jgi:histone deacetylase complex regulatory component SIN3
MELEKHSKKKAGLCQKEAQKMLNEIEEKNYRKSLLDYKAQMADEYAAKCRKE